MDNPAPIRTSDPAPADDDEALAALIQIAGRRTLPIPADLLARHALALPGPWQWPVRRAAFEAILRRLASARSEEFRVLETPKRGPFGRYLLGRPADEGVTPYETRFSSLLPVRGTCTCADFLHASLGVCKHVLAVLDHLSKKRNGLGEVALAPDPERDSWRLRWDPYSPSMGPWDPLDGVILVEPENADDAVGPPSDVLRLFGRRRRLGALFVYRLAATHAEYQAARLQLVDRLKTTLRSFRGADPALRVVLDDESRRLRRMVSLSGTQVRLTAALRLVRRRLYSYQREGIQRFLAEGRLVLADDMGLGKTTQAIAAVAALFESGLSDRALIIVPASLKPQWEREWNEVSATPLRLVEGTQKGRAAIYAKTRRGVLISNYEQVVRDIKDVTAWCPNTIVLDEAQRNKNWATKTAQTIKTLRPAYRLVLTGTPMENRLEELSSIVEWVDERAIEPKWRLIPAHSVLADGKREVIGAQHLNHLRARLAPIMLRRLRTEVLSQLPARQDTVVPVDLSPEQREAHDELLLPIAKLASIAHQRPLLPHEFLRLMTLLATQRMISNGMAQVNFDGVWPTLRGQTPTPSLIDTLAMPKLLELRELIANLVVTQKRKIVIFSQWRRMLELSAWAIGDVLAAAGKRALFFTGQESGRRRTQNVVEFHDDPNAAVLFLTDAGGVGLNLQKAATACINLEMPWNPAVLEQRIGRIYRIGQKHPIDVFNVMSRNCIEERISSLVADKRALFKGLLEGNADELRFERAGSLLAVLERITAGPGSSVAKAPAVGGGSSTELQAALEPPKSPITAPAARRPHEKSPEVVDLMSSLRIERGTNGAIRIEAPPEAAATLAALFGGLAKMLGAIAADRD